MPIRNPKSEIRNRLLLFPRFLRVTSETVSSDSQSIQKEREKFMPNGLYRSLFQKIFSIGLLTSILAGAFPAVPGQTRRKPAVTKTSAPVVANSPNACKGGWSGIVKISKTLNENTNSGKLKGVTAITTQHFIERDYKYTGKMVIDGSNPRATQTKGQVIFTDVEKKRKRVEAREDCRYDKQPSIDIWKEETDNEKTNTYGEGSGDFWLNVNELNGTYSFNFRLPESKGITETESKTEAKQCVKQEYPPRNKNFPVIVPGEGAEIDDQKIDPRNPDVLSGSKSWDTSTPTLKSFTYTVSWSFKRCPAPIEVTGIRFDERPYGKPNAWQEIREDGDTIDGNLVRIRATVVNFSGETRFPTIKFHELVENWELPETEKSIRLEAGEEKEVEVEWDTSGYAWRGKGWDAESNRKIKVEAIDEGRTTALTKPLTVSPRPVVLVHGLWSNALAWNEYKNFFYEAHSTKWDSFAVGEEVLIGKMNTGDHFGNWEKTNTISENAVVLNKQIEHVRQLRNAWHVDLVVHSMGGLISRYYVQNFMPNSIDEKPVVTRLIMLGTPNMGSPCADLMYNAFYLYHHRVEALRELKPEIVEQFNANVTERRGVRFSALVGKAIPQTCQSREGGDGVVPISSAQWEIRDWRFSNSLAHTDLTSHADFGAFVFPRLSIGPRGDHSPAPPDREKPNPMKPIIRGAVKQTPADRFGGVFQNASYERRSEPADETVPEGLMAKEIKLAPGQSAEIEIPAPRVPRLSIVFAAPPNVSAVLLDAAGGVLGQNAAGSPEARQMFRTIWLEKAASGNLKLKFENREPRETIIYAAVFADADPFVLSLTAGKPTGNGQVPLQAKLTNGGAPLPGALVRARILGEDGKPVELELLDDGAHGDGASGDGVYGAQTAGLANGDYTVTARAETGGQSVSAATGLTIGAAQKETAPVKTTVKKTKK